MQVTVVIRDPARRKEDVLVACDPAWTIWDLKQCLHSHVALHASVPTSQKLVYRGNLLSNQQLLRDALEKNEEQHIVFLVAAAREASDATAAAAATPSGSIPQCTVQQGVVTTPAVGQMLTSPQSQFRGVAGTVPGFETHTAYRQHLHWLQQVYARQYYLRYGMVQGSWAVSHDPSANGDAGEVAAPDRAPNRNAVGGAMLGDVVNMGGVNVGQPANGDAAAQDGALVPANENDAGRPAEGGANVDGADDGGANQIVANGAAVGGANGRGALVAGGANVGGAIIGGAMGGGALAGGGGAVLGGALVGGAMGEDDGLGRADWLDWLHSLACGAALLAILYQYSSLGRMVVVLVTMLLLYLYHTGMFPFRRAALPAVAPAVAVAENRNEVAQPAPVDDAGAIDADGAVEMDGAADTTTDSDGRAVAAPSADPHSWIQSLSVSVCSFFFSFFASLLPEGPQQDGRN